MRWSTFWKHFVINVVIGLALMFVLGLPFVQKNSAVATLRDGVINWQIDKLKGIEGAQEIAWINVDTRTYKEWGEPLITRRDKLARLIDFAMANEPRAVIVDIDLSAPSPLDAALVRTLQRYTRCQNMCGPPIILVRSFAECSACPGHASPGAAPGYEAVPSFLDRALGTAPDEPWRAAGNVQWGAVTTDHDPDHIVRRWRLWENSCTTSGNSVLTPSIVLLAVAEQRRTFSEIRDALQPHAQACAAVGQASQPFENSLSGIGNPPHSVALTERALQRRIIYRVSWESVNGPASNQPLGAVLAAGPIAQGAAVDGSVLRDRIVVIGSSWDPLDVHRTPIGEMPGTLVLINEVNSLEHGDTLSEPNWLTHYTLEIGLILFVSLVFAMLPPAYALLVVIAAIVGGTLTLGLVAFNAGVWVDSVIPLAGVLLHEVISRVRERFAHRS